MQAVEYNIKNLKVVKLCYYNFYYFIVALYLTLKIIDRVCVMILGDGVYL